MASTASEEAAARYMDFSAHLDAFRDCDAACRRDAEAVRLQRAEQHRQEVATEASPAASFRRGRWRAVRRAGVASVLPEM